MLSFIIFTACVFSAQSQQGAWLDGTFTYSQLGVNPSYVTGLGSFGHPGKSHESMIDLLANLTMIHRIMLKVVCMYPIRSFMPISHPSPWMPTTLVHTWQSFMHAWFTGTDIMESLNTQVHPTPLGKMQQRITQSTTPRLSCPPLGPSPSLSRRRPCGN